LVRCADAYQAAEMASFNTSAEGADLPEINKQVKFVRCIFGSLPFHSIVLESARLSATVTSLAAGIYQERAFDRLPILADALEDAGCDNQDVLSHLRGGGVDHVRGCWPVDLLLAKE
jgi:hypothetical protein